MSNMRTVNKNIVSLVGAINALMEGFLTTQNKRKAVSCVKTYTSDEFQSQLLQIIKDNIPQAPKATRKSRGPKDPLAPKNARSAYMCFCNANRVDVKKELLKTQDVVKMQDVSKALGAMWAKVKGTAKEAKWQEMSKADKERYANEVEDYTPSAEYLEKVAAWEVKQSEPKKPKKPRDPTKPKGATSAWMYFCKAKRPLVKAKMERKSKDAKVKMTDVTKELGAMWKKCKEAKKDKKYIKLAAADKERYTSEMEDYEPSDEFLDAMEQWKAAGGVERKRSSPKTKTTTTTRKKRDPDAPKKPKTAYNFFAQEIRPTLKEDNPSMKASEVTAIIRDMWSGRVEDDEDNYSTAEARAKWLKMAAKDKVRYASEMKMYTPPSDDEDEDEDGEVTAPAPKTSTRGKGGRGLGEHKRRPSVKLEVKVPEPESESDSDDESTVRQTVRNKVAANRRKIGNAATQPPAQLMVSDSELDDEEESGSDSE